MGMKTHHTFQLYNVNKISPSLHDSFKTCKYLLLNLTKTDMCNFRFHMLLLSVTKFRQ